MTDDPYDDFQDPTTGRIKPGWSGHSPEKAREYGRKGGISRSRKNKDLDNAIEAILRGRGYESPFDPEAFEFVRQFVVEGSSTAWDRLERIAPIKQSKKADEAGTVSPDALALFGRYVKIPHGSRCPWCGDWSLDIDVDLASLKDADPYYRNMVETAHHLKDYLRSRGKPQKGTGTNSPVETDENR